MSFQIIKLLDCGLINVQWFRLALFYYQNKAARLMFYISKAISGSEH